METIYNFFLNYHLWFKALHVVAIISWMVGLLYLPRLFVYHSTAEEGSNSSEMLKIMEYKLQKFIMTPAMIVSIGAGIVLLITKNIDWTTKWIYIKLIAVSGLVYIHYLLARYRKLFSIDKNTHTKNFYKILNEIPTVLLIIIIIMVYIKPF